MKFTSFEAKNFKGISHVRLDFDTVPKSKVYTLVGLNESGKTTILEAINFLSVRTEKVKTSESPDNSVKDPRDLIPLGQRANFNGEIMVKAQFQFEEEDKKRFKDFLEKELKYELAEELDYFTVSKTFIFKDSITTDSASSTTWSLVPKVRKISVLKYGKSKAGTKILTLDGSPATRPDWNKMAEFVRKLIPSVLYFPNFLFDFPNKIYLQNSPQFSADEKDKYETYKQILQDVLDAMGGNMVVEKHILERAQSDVKHDKQALESVERKMGGHLTTTIFDNWNRIFGRAIGNKKIDVKCDKDEIGWYLQLRIEDGTNVYEIAERSLGFRWFFAFMLLTQYRGFRKGDSDNVLFLLDEPASNLHPSAQQQLLGSFGKMPNCAVVYTTHSHHLINPEWLESTFVVRNAGLKYGADEDYNASDTDITIERYRTFVATYPDQTTYFQPVLDVLAYKVGKLENVPDVVMVEGKNDFYTLKYMQELLAFGDEINFMPGGSASSLDDVIRLYIGWGRNFIIVLDSDREGREQKVRYQELFGPILSDRTFLLMDVESRWQKSTEDLFGLNDRLAIQQAVFPDDVKFHKGHFNRAIQELFLTGKKITISEETKVNFNKLFEFCSEKLRFVETDEGTS